jgi:hypothetical protein
MKLRCFSEYTDADYHSFWFECSPRVLGIAPGTSGFSPATASASTKAVTVSLSSFSLFYRVHQRSSGLSLNPVSRNCEISASLGVSCPFRVSPYEAAALSRLRPSTVKAFSPPGFLNLVTLSSTSYLPALFHAGSTLGIFPSRAFLLNWCSSTPSPTPLPSCRYDTRPSTSSLTDLPISRRPASPVCGSSSVPRLQGFAPHQSLPLRADGLDRPERMALMGVSCPPRCSPSSAQPSFHSISPLKLPRFRPQAANRQRSSPRASQGFHC